MKDVGAIVQVEVARLDAALLSDGGVRSVSGNQCQIVAQAQVHGQFWRGFPRILEVPADHAAEALVFVYVADDAAGGQSHQKRRQSETARGVGGIGGLRRVERGVGVFVIFLETRSRQLSAHLKSVAAHDLGERTLDLVNIGLVGHQPGELTAGKIARYGHVRHQGSAVQEGADLIGREIQTLQETRRQAVPAVLGIVLLAGTAVLDFHDRTRAEGADVAETVILARIMDLCRQPRQADRRPFVQNDTAEPEPDEIPGANTLIDFGGVFVLRLNERSRIDGIVRAHAGGKRIMRQERLRVLEHGGIEHRRWNHIARKWVADISRGVVGVRPGSVRVIDLPGLVREIASQFLRRGDLNVGVIRLAVAKTLIPEKEKRLVFAVIDLRNPHRPAEDSPELILVERSHGGIERIAGIEIAVPQILPDGPVIAVGAGLGHYVHDPARGRSELGLVVVGVNLELLDRVDNRRHHVGAHQRVLIVEAVQHEDVPAILSAVHRREIELRPLCHGVGKRSDHLLRAVDGRAAGC